MAKPEWGVKRACLSCGGRFYDMRKSPIVCPKCETVFEPEATLRARRVQRAAPEKKPKVEAAVPEAENEDLPVAEDQDTALADDVEVDTGEEEDDAGLIEDTEDFAKDDVAVAPIVNDDDEDK